MKPNIIKSIMVRQNITVADVVSQMKMSRNTWYSRMSGESSFTIEEAVRLCNILKIDDLRTRAEIFLP